VPDRPLKALTFDVFGTVVDWRSSIARQGATLNAQYGWEVDWTALADDWRGRYQPSMSAVRDGKRPWTILDILHRESLVELAPAHGLHGLDDSQINEINHMWHRLDPWPDAVEGLARLKKQYVIATLSNGNVALLVNMAKRAGLPWDAILGAEVARCYKPMPEAYLTTVRMLDLSPSECMMVAAHNSDLAAARALGFRTAFVCRPREYGPAQSTDLAPDSDWDVVAESFTELASKLGT